MQTFYKELITAKTGTIIPVLQNGKTLDSIYNPETDCERKFNALQNIDEKIILIYGLGSGLLIEKLHSVYPKSKILCVEFSKEDITLLQEIPTLKSIFSTPNILIFPKEDLVSTLIQEYVPALYGNLKIIELPGYLSQNSEYAEYLKTQTENALRIISNDYSAQSHFGKIWQHNIIKNIKLFSKFEKKDISLENSKTCVVLAAGPGLEDCLNELKHNRTNFFIIATDTAYSVLVQNDIPCDAVLSIDAQNISINHYIHKHSTKTVFLSDFCTNPSIPIFLLKKNHTVKYFGSGHPLTNEFLGTKAEKANLYPGSGTVTIAALDLALKIDFKKIIIYGADFSFPHNKPYAKGTYLDALYNKCSSKVNTSEKEFCHLMFRTELINTENGIKTTETLLSYRNSLEKYLDEYKKNGIISWKKEQNVYVLEKNHENINKDFLNIEIDENQFFKKFSNKKNFTSDEISACLPYIAYLRRKNPSLDFEEYLEMAAKSLRRNFEL